MPETPFDILQAHFGPRGQGSRKPCHVPGEDGYGTSCNVTILDDKHPMFKATWERCHRLRLTNSQIHLHSWDEDDTCIYDRTERRGAAGRECSYMGCCKATGWLLRSREQAALLLPDAARQAGFVLTLQADSNGWIVNVQRPGRQGYAWLKDWLDALSAAILVAEEGKEVKA